MKTRSNNTYHIVRRVVKKGTRPPRVLRQLGIGKCTADSATSKNDNLDGHQERDTPNPDPSGIRSNNNQKEKRKKGTREDYKELIYDFYTALERPSRNTTESTFRIWNERNPNARPNIDSNKLANTRRYILDKKKLTDAELEEIRNKVRKENEAIESVNRNNNNNIFDEIPLDEVSDDDSINDSRRNSIRYDDLVNRYDNNLNRNNYNDIDILDEIPVDELSDDNNVTKNKRNSVRYDDLDTHPRAQSRKRKKHICDKRELEGINVTFQRKTNT